MNIPALLAMLLLALLASCSSSGPPYQPAALERAESRLVVYRYEATSHDKSVVKCNGNSWGTIKSFGYLEKKVRPGLHHVSVEFEPDFMGKHLPTGRATVRVNAGEEVFLRYDLKVTSGGEAPIALVSPVPVAIPVGTPHGTLRQVNRETAQNELSYCGEGEVLE